MCGRRSLVFPNPQPSFLDIYEQLCRVQTFAFFYWHRALLIVVLQSYLDCISWILAISAVASAFWPEINARTQHSDSSTGPTFYLYIQIGIKSRTMYQMNHVWNQSILNIQIMIIIAVYYLSYYTIVRPGPPYQQPVPDPRCKMVQLNSQWRNLQTHWSIETRPNCKFMLTQTFWPCSIAAININTIANVALLDVRLIVATDFWALGNTYEGDHHLPGWIKYLATAN